MRLYTIFRILFLLGCCGLLCCSCNSHKRLTKPTSLPAELTRKLGFQVSRHDDLKLYREAAQWLGTPYRYGGKSKKGTDCSGLVNQIYQNVYRIPLERTVAGMADKNCRKVNKTNLAPGDLVFFCTSKKKKGINHVGLFLKEDYFIHASTSRGVIVSNLKEEYYRKTWKKGGRVKK